MSKTPKWRPVFGEKLPPGFKPPTHEAGQPSVNNSSKNAVSSRPLEPSNKQNPKTSIKSVPKPNAVPQKKLKPESWPDYLAKMDPLERILLAFTVYRQPKDVSIDQFYSYNYDSFRYLDRDLLGPDYPEAIRIISKWKKVGLMVEGRYSNLLSLEKGVTEAFWQFIDDQVYPELSKLVPVRSYTADLSGTLDNIFNFLVMVEQGEVSITRAREVNKNSLKRVLTALTEPARPDKLFTMESYFFWLLGVVNFFKLISPKGDRLALTALGRELTEHITVEDLLCQIFPSHLNTIPNKGFFLMLPLLVNCTEWTSWTQKASKLIPANFSRALFPRDRVISLLDPMRFLGLLDWGEYQEDILVRLTPLGQFIIPKLLKRQKVEDYVSEIKCLIDQVYPTSGPDTAYVQPNFEILLPHSVSWSIRWQLSQFALLVQQDQMLKYRLDKNYLMNALKRGVPASKVLTLLAKLSAYPLPENLVLTLQQWVESFGQVTFVQLSLLECTTPEQAASIASARKYREYVLGLYSPTVVIVRETEKLRKLLEKQGIFPLPGVLDGKGVAERLRSSDEV
ncbi:helicase-associated domain-containing protein [Desulfosporosinus nitroreducens]|uniref:Helicase-associated domain-containing protein n=1 Tax=Desulfosporosinus nitroreducens TaxID=2018668 RepID=A0ABT8QPN8_9FIRM|nr:helicase-associated domain-containing protein [Desulfosporosinus nitroreducens]MCO1603410.1 helicase-associated domain-containing protein [Desulfosporosinus nitroreducens]MDO0823250.1 helicase-associated domain-containing protein [Desulfosporosinus nitroreducens]